MSTTQIELVTYISAAVCVCDFFFPQKNIILKQKAKEVGAGKGGVKTVRRKRRNSLVKEFKWNDEKKLEGRTG